MKFFQYFSVILTIAILAGCSKDKDIDYRISNSIFIEDAENPGLPIYSEKGYNSFGIYWDLLPLNTELPHNPSKFIVIKDTSILNLTGSVGTISYTLSISIPDYQPKNYEALVTLNNNDYDLSKEDCIISLQSGGDIRKLEIFEGNFTIKKAQNLYVDKVLNGVVLSGILSFKALLDKQPVTFSNGRFDMRFGNENFYNMQELQ